MMTKKRSVPRSIRQVRRVKSRNLFRTGPKSPSPGSFVYIDVPKAKKDYENSIKYTIENEFSLSDSEVNSLDSGIDATANDIRDSLMLTLTGLAGYDKASGQIEAVARDFLETEVEHDSSVHTLVQVTAQLDVLCLLASRFKNIPEDVRTNFLIQSATALALDLPAKLVATAKVDRHKQHMDNMIAVVKQRAVGNGVAPQPEGPYITGR